MRVLLAFEEEYRVHMEVVANVIRLLRSYVQVALSNTHELEAEVERFNPQLVICTSPIPSNPVEPQLIASIELSPEPSQASRFRVGERRWESTNPTIGETLSVVDETNLLYMTTYHEAESIDTDEEGLLTESFHPSWQPLP